MKQLLKDTLKLWIGVIIVFLFIAIIIGLPILLCEHTGLGIWQIIAAVLWVSFWLSFIFVAGGRDVEKNKENEDKR